MPEDSPAASRALKNRLKRILKARIRVTEDDFDEWKQHPVTLKVWQMLMEEFGARRLSMSDGSCKGETAEKTGLAYAEQSAVVSVLRELLDITFEGILESKDFDEIAELRLQEEENADQVRQS